MKFKEQLFKAGSLEWLEARLHNITATEFASICGLNTRNSAAAVGRDKIEPKYVSNQYTRRGKIGEPAVMEALYQDMDLDVLPYGKRGFVSFFQHPDGALSATPDAKILGKDKKIKSIVECKTASEIRMEDWDFNAPIPYILQVHVQMMCTGIQDAYLAGLGFFDPGPLVVYKVKWDERINERALQIVARWWEAFNNKEDYKVNKEDKKDIKEWALASTTRVY